jgi:hypothetical protein
LQAVQGLAGVGELGRVGRRIGGAQRKSEHQSERIN